jgi:hypothetical protein
MAKHEQILRIYYGDLSYYSDLIEYVIVSTVAARHAIPFVDSI